MAITNGMASTFKSEILSGGHNFNATVTPTGNTHTSTLVDTVSSMAGVAIGMLVTGSGVAANTYISAINSSASFTISIATSSTLTTTPLTISGDTFKMALIKVGAAGTYSTANVNYTDITVATDEASGAGYSSGGATLVTVSPVVSGTTAYINFTNPTWSSATLSTIGCMIYNSSVRIGGTSGTNTTGAGRCCAVYDFGGTQTVTGGTFTILMPTAAAGTAILRIA